MLRVKKILLVLVLICSLILTGCSFGTKGNVWLIGTTAPDEKSKGRIGDMYLNTETFDLYQLSKSGWSLIGNISGEDGEDGEDGITPVVEINKSGNWLINGKDTGVKALGEDGQDAITKIAGKEGQPGKNGKDGVNGKSPTISISNDGYWIINGQKTKVKAIPEKATSFYVGYDGYVYNGAERTVYHMLDENADEETIEKTLGIEGVMSNYFKGDYVDLSTNTVALMSNYMPNAKLTTYSGSTITEISVYAKEAGKLNIGTAKVADVVNARLNGTSYTIDTVSCNVEKGLNIITLELEVAEDETIVLGGNGSVGLYYATGIDVDDEQGIFTTINSKTNSNVINKTNEIKDKLDIQIKGNFDGKEQQFFENNTSAFTESMIQSSTSYDFNYVSFAYQNSDYFSGKTITKIGVPIKTVKALDNNQFFTIYIIDKNSVIETKAATVRKIIQINVPKELLGTSTTVNKWVYVDISDYNLKLAEDETLAFTSSSDTITPGYITSIINSKYSFYTLIQTKVTKANENIFWDIWYKDAVSFDEHIKQLKEKETQASK